MRGLILASAAAITLSACQSEPAPQHPDVTIYPARAVLTMESPAVLGADPVVANEWVESHDKHGRNRP